MSINRTITITLADAASPHETRPAEVRLRAVLKLLLRGYVLRSVNIQPAIPDDPLTIIVDDNPQGGR